jgi:energy-coupling factor transporter ATP-binding protein EcfA2
MEKISIRTNNHIHFTTKTVDKQELKDQAELYNKPDCWEIKNWDVKEIAEYIGNGYTVSPSVKGLSYCLFLDFDNSTVAETMENVWTANASILYSTPSAFLEDKKDKHRLMFIYDRPVSAEEHRHIFNKMLAIYGDKADKTRSVNWLFFGSHKTGVTILSENEKLVVEGFLDDFAPPSQKEIVIPTTDTEKSKLNLKKAVLSYINTEVWLGLCNGKDIDRLYALHDHNFTFQGKDTISKLKWGGHRPEDTDKNHGTGFYVYQGSADAPPRFTNEVNGVSGSIIDYWHHYNKKEYGSIFWNDDRKHKNYTKVVDDICEHFEIAKFDIQGYLKDIDLEKRQQAIDGVEELYRICDEYVRIIDNSDPRLYCYYNRYTRSWKISKDIEMVWGECVKHYLIEAGGDDIELTFGKIAGQYRQAIKYYTGLKYIDKKQFDGLGNRYILPMSNGDYDLNTKEFLEEYDHKIYNQHRYYTKYRQIDFTKSEGVRLLNEWLTHTYGTAETRQAVLDWLSLSVMGLAGKTQKMLCLWGAPGSGKSVILSLINNILGNMGTTIDNDKLLGKDNRFIFQGMDGKYAVTIDEFDTNQNGWNKLKKLTGSDEPNIDVENKGKCSYTAKFIGGITTASQDRFTLPNKSASDGGVRRRIVTVEHKEDVVDPKYFDIAVKLNRTDLREDIFLWLITMDTEAAIKRFVQYAGSSHNQNNIRNIALDSDDIFAFMTDRLEFTDNPEDTISNVQLGNEYLRFVQEELSEKVDINHERQAGRIVHYIAEKVRVKANGIRWDLKPVKGVRTKVKVGSAFINGVKGIRFKKAEKSTPASTEKF